MATLEEITAWSLQEIRLEIQELLPKDWWFEEEGVGPQSLRARIMRPSEEGPVVEWSNYHVDERILLLGAYGFLWARNHEPSSCSPWVRRRNPTRDAVTQRVAVQTSCGVPDPEDVDPEEVLSVYDELRKKT